MAERRAASSGRVSLNDGGNRASQPRRSQVGSSWRFVNVMRPASPPSASRRIVVAGRPSVTATPSTAVMAQAHGPGRQSYTATTRAAPARGGRTANV